MIAFHFEAQFEGERSGEVTKRLVVCGSAGLSGARIVSDSHLRPSA
jgi:hypothetical protein